MTTFQAYLRTGCPPNDRHRLQDWTARRKSYASIERGGVYRGLGTEARAMTGGIRACSDRIEQFGSHVLITLRRVVL